MVRPGLLLLLLLLALQPLQPSSLPRPDTTEGKVTILGLILSALERATLFLEERLPGVNLDGVVGFRVLEAAPSGETHPAENYLSECITRQLADKLAALLRRSIFYLELSDPRYLREFRPSLQPGFWKLPRTWTHTNTSLVYPVLEPEDSFSEESSDACLVQLLGTGNSSQPCRIPDFCRTLVTQPNCSGYRLSHQLLFFLWARMQGCTEGLFHQSQHYISVFCANMMELNWRAEAIGYAYPTRDLFMENNVAEHLISLHDHFLPPRAVPMTELTKAPCLLPVMLCGISGFSDFYKLRWLEAILSWQRPWEGCFGKPGELHSCPGREGCVSGGKGRVGVGAPERSRHACAGVGSHTGRNGLGALEQGPSPADGCSCHSTGEAGGRPGVYVLAESPPAKGELRLSTRPPLSGS
uniref:Uncharacterized protein n=1 Tax=Spermophilus dauricus TaxID=99837 RepID=A0A8C9PG21_SPEDA